MMADDHLERIHEELTDELAEANKVCAEAFIQLGRMSAPKRAARVSESKICQCSFQRIGFMGRVLGYEW